MKFQISNFKFQIFLSLFTICCSLFTVSDAYAMHISEGILPFNWAALWFAVAAPFVAYGLYSLKKKSSDDWSFKPLVGLIVAVVFIISCMPVPVPTAGTSSHPTGVAISAILLGPAISVVVAAAALLIQAVFLAHGGLSTLGANIVSMGIMGSIAGYITFKAMRSIPFFNKGNRGLAVSGFMAGVFADWATYTMTSIELAAGIMGESQFFPLFTKILIAFMPTQLPLGILEGAMTAGMVTLLYKKRPDILVKIKVLKPEEVAA
jgi:cobalt/nickel transport system permease protein